MKLIGVRVTLIRGPGESVCSRGGSGDCEFAGAGSVGAGAGSGLGSVTGEGAADEVREDAADDVRGDDVLVATDWLTRVDVTGVDDVLVSSRGLAGISPEKLLVRSRAVATTKVAAASPINSSSNRDVRCSRLVGTGCTAALSRWCSHSGSSHSGS